jgi:hypothetical protein
MVGFQTDAGIQSNRYAKGPETRAATAPTPATGILFAISIGCRIKAVHPERTYVFGAGRRPPAAAPLKCGTCLQYGKNDLIPQGCKYGWILMACIFILAVDSGPDRGDRPHPFASI